VKPFGDRFWRVSFGETLKLLKFAIFFVANPGSNLVTCSLFTTEDFLLSATIAFVCVEIEFCDGFSALVDFRLGFLGDGESSLAGGSVERRFFEILGVWRLDCSDERRRERDKSFELFIDVRMLFPIDFMNFSKTFIAVS